MQAVISAAGERVLDELEVGIASVWHGEAFARTRRLPGLADWFPKRGKKAEPREQTTDEMLAMLQTIMPPKLKPEPASEE